MLFPLPLTPFERYYLADDSPDYPTTIPVEVVLSGELEEAAFRRALRLNVARHPLLHALVADGPTGLQWIGCESAEPWLDWAPEGTLIGHPDGEYIDLRKAPGLRVWVRASTSEARLLIQLHHACCDGVSTLQFIGDLMAYYTAEQQGLAPESVLATLPLERLRDREAVDAGDSRAMSFFTGLRDSWVTARVWGRVLLRRCAVLAPPDRRDHRIASPTQPIASREFLAFETHVLTAEQTQQLKKAAAARSVTANDLLLRDALVVIRDWNLAGGARRVGACRINMPVYVRGRGVPPMPASNGIGFSFVTVNPDRHSDDAILTEVHEQTQQIKQWKLALYFLGGLAAASNYPSIIRWTLGRRRPFATFVLSNLAQALAVSPLPRRADGCLICGNVVLEHVAGVPPVRPLTRASMVVLEYGGRLAIALRCDAHLFRTADTRALLDQYVAQVCASHGSLWCDV
ncbi:MAG: hypothetical protein WD845_16465 [Pirellulales bacterium]